MPSLSRLRPYRCFFQQHTNYSGVSPSDFARIERERDRRRRKFRFRRYDAKNHMLIMALMTRVHETLHARLFSMLVKFSQGQDQLVLEKWEEEELLAPPGPLTRSRARQCGKRSRLVETGQMPSHTRSLGGRWCSGSSFCFCEIRIRISGRGTLSLAFPALQRYAKHVWGAAARG